MAPVEDTLAAVPTKIEGEKDSTEASTPGTEKSGEGPEGELQLSCVAAADTCGRCALLFFFPCFGC